MAQLNAQQERALRQLVFVLVEGQHAYIAGGFAADYTQANDIDLWVLGDPTLEKTATELTRIGVRYEAVTRGDASSVPPEEISRSVLRVSLPILPLHIIGVEETTIKDLLATFDISTHRWAVSRTGTLIAGEGATKPWEPGKVLTYRFPNSTDARVKKLQDRYGIDIAKYVPPKTTTKKESAV